MDIVITEHHCQKLNGFGGADQWCLCLALDPCGEQTGFYLGCLVNTRGQAMGNTVEQKGLFPSRLVFQSLVQAGDLFGAKQHG